MKTSASQLLALSKPPLSGFLDRFLLWKAEKMGVSKYSVSATLDEFYEWLGQEASSGQAVP